MTSNEATNKDILDALKTVIAVPEYVQGAVITLSLSHPPTIVWETIPEKRGPITMSLGAGK